MVFAGFANSEALCTASKIIAVSLTLQSTPVTSTITISIHTLPTIGRIFLLMTTFPFPWPY